MRRAKFGIWPAAIWQQIALAKGGVHGDRSRDVVTGRNGAGLSGRLRRGRGRNRGGRLCPRNRGARARPDACAFTGTHPDTGPRTGACTCTCTGPHAQPDARQHAVGYDGPGRGDAF